MRTKKKQRFIIAIIWIISTLILTACYSRGKEEESVVKISPFRMEQSAFLQLYIPNKTQSCLISELSGVSEIDESKEIEEALRLLRKRTMESSNFVSMEKLVFLNISIVADTVFIEYEFQEDIQLDEMEEALTLYSIINTATAHQNIEFVKLSNSSSDKYFFSKYNIDVPLASTNALLYKDYVSPIQTVANLLNAIVEKRELPSIADNEVSAILQSITFEIKRFDIMDYEYNKYGDFVTVRSKIIFGDNLSNEKTMELSFLLELLSGRFEIKEIIAHEDE